MKTIRKIRKATYLNEFKCIGGSCEDNCCIGWSVEIDKNTFTKYGKLKDFEIATLVKRYIYVNEDCYDANVDYGLVELKENKRCPFLNECNLCRIQARLGESYLSNVCATYPRLANHINGVVEYSATLSCPEAARLVLSKKEGLLFKEEEENRGIRNIISVSVDTKEQAGMPPVEYLIELREFTIRILQLRTYFLWERILIIGLFFQEIQKDIEIEKGSNIVGIISSFVEKLEKDGFKEELAKLKKSESRQVEILKEITDPFNNSKEIDSKEYLALIQEFLLGIGAKKNSAIEDIKAQYHMAYNDFYEPFMKEKEYMLENYMVNYVFQSLFPAAESVNTFEAYQKLVIRYSLIKFYLIGIGKHRGALNEGTFIEFIQVFSKALEHNYHYFEKISAYIKTNGYNTMEYMGILVRN